MHNPPMTIRLPTLIATSVGRGADRGLRGIEFDGEDTYIAASDELFCYDRNFQVKKSYKNPYLEHCHEIVRGFHLRRLRSTTSRLNKLSVLWTCPWIYEMQSMASKCGPGSHSKVIKVTRMFCRWLNIGDSFETDSYPLCTHDLNFNTRGCR